MLIIWTQNKTSNITYSRPFFQEAVICSTRVWQKVSERIFCNVQKTLKCQLRIPPEKCITSVNSTSINAQPPKILSNIWLEKTTLNQGNFRFWQSFLCRYAAWGGEQTAPFPLHAPASILPNSCFPQHPSEWGASWMATRKKDGERISQPCAHRLS